LRWSCDIAAATDQRIKPVWTSADGAVARSGLGLHPLCSPSSRAKACEPISDAFALCSSAGHRPLRSLLLPRIGNQPSWLLRVDVIKVDVNPRESCAARVRTVRFTISSRVNYEFATPGPTVSARLRTMAALRETVDTLYASGLEIRPAEGLVLASGRALGAPNAGPGFSASTSPHAAGDSGDSGDRDAGSGWTFTIEERTKRRRVRYAGLVCRRRRRSEATPGDPELARAAALGPRAVRAADLAHLRPPSKHDDAGSVSGVCRRADAGLVRCAEQRPEQASSSRTAR
jgi:hypothetical protein